MRVLKITMIVLLLNTLNVFAQECNCEQEFLFVKQHMEENYAGFQDKVTVKTRAAYDKTAAVFTGKAQKIKQQAQCIFLMKTWLETFKDGHINIVFNEKVLAAKKEIKDFQQYIDDTEKITLSDTKIKQLEKATGIEGIYWNYDSTYQIAVVKNKTNFRDYAGIMLHSETPFWTKDQVKIEFKKSNDTVAKGILYYKNHLPDYQEFNIGINNIGEWQRQGTKRSGKAVNNANVDGKKLSDKTFYIKISSFKERNAKAIDSLFQQHQTDLEKMSNLILDLRNNGGGADFTFTPILPYLYTNPVKNIGADVWATTANSKGWEALLNYPDMPQKTKDAVVKIVEEMNSSKGKWVDISGDYIDSTGVTLKYPEKIMILINKGCASTTEEFLLKAKQSRKVQLLGENTHGVLDYSNMRGTDFPCMPYQLRYATTRSRRLNVGLGIDNVGIAPHIRLDKNKDWIQEALHIAEQ